MREQEPGKKWRSDPKRENGEELRKQEKKTKELLLEKKQDGKT